MFPPKEIVVTPEGEPEEVEHIAQGEVQESDAPGFAIYIDEERYYMEEENGMRFHAMLDTFTSDFNYEDLQNP